MMREPELGAPVIEEQAVFGAAGEHSVGLVGSFCHEVIDENTDVGFMAPKDDWVHSPSLVGGVDAGDEALPCSLLIAGSPVDLASQEQVFNPLGFERRIKLRGGAKSYSTAYAGLSNTAFSSPGML